MLVNTNLTPLRKAIKDAYRYARTGDSRVTKAVGDYLTLGKDIPMATTMYKTEEMYEAKRHFNILLDTGRIKDEEEYNKQWRNMLKIIGDQEAVPENAEAEKDFYTTFGKQYPKNLKKKMAIITEQMKEMFKKIDEE